MPRKRYKTLKQLKAAYDSGQLSKKSPLTLDNDCSSVYVLKDGDEFGMDAECVFEGVASHPAALLEAALDLLGIPWRHC